MPTSELVLGCKGIIWRSLLARTFEPWNAQQQHPIIHPALDIKLHVRVCWVGGFLIGRAILQLFASCGEWADRRVGHYFDRSW